MIRYSFITLIVLFGLLCCLTIASANPYAQETGSSGSEHSQAFGSDPEDPRNLLNEVRKRRAQRESLFPVSPLKGVHDATGKTWDEIYEATHIKLGMTLNHLFQWSSDSLPGKDSWGMTTDLDLVGSWELVNRGMPDQGEIFFGVEGRWDYGTTGPQDIGFGSLATAGGTANAFSKYIPTFIVRNLYWEQGGPETEWAYRIGKITPDAILATSRHITPVTTYLPNVGTGLFSSGYPDSGLGAVVVKHFNEQFKVLGLVSDSNADRFDFGDVDGGDYYKSLEFGCKINPKTEKAGFSKLTLWHSDGTKNGKPINASTGQDGYGVTIKLEQELSDDGRQTGIVRWGKSWDDSSIYTQQVGVHYLLYDPDGPAGLKNDVIGIAANWVESVVDGARDEYNVEVFYRVPLFPGVDTRLSYQYVINPALTREIDHASVFSLGLRTVF